MKLIKVNKEQKERALEIAEAAWQESGCRLPVARRLARRNVVKEFGSIIIWVTLSAAILDICYTLFKIWRDLQVTDPRAQDGWKSSIDWESDE